MYSLAIVHAQQLWLSIHSAHTQAHSYSEIRDFSQTYIINSICTSFDLTLRTFGCFSLTNVEKLPRIGDAKLGSLEDKGDVNFTRSGALRNPYSNCICTQHLQIGKGRVIVLQIVCTS